MKKAERDTRDFLKECAAADKAEEAQTIADRQAMEDLERSMMNEIQFGTLHPDGSLTNVRHIRQSTIAACPHVILVPEHYREDGSCKCNDPQEQAMMIQDWGYSKGDFK